MAIKIQTVDESIDNNGVKCLVHGLSGSGKTMLIATADGRVLLISAESGLRSLKDVPQEIKDRIDVITIYSVTDLEGAYVYAEEHLGEYNWLCLDSVSEIAEQVLQTEKRRNKDGREAYGKLADQMEGLLKAFRDLPNINVLMTAKQALTADGHTGVTLYRPMLPGRILTGSIAYLFDEVFAIRVVEDDEGEPIHILQCKRDIQYEAKDRSGRLDRFERPHLGSLLDKMIGDTSENNDGQAEVDIGGSEGTDKDEQGTQEAVSAGA
jgi:phage nucleotide-binding protein